MGQTIVDPDSLKSLLASYTPLAYPVQLMEFVRFASFEKSASALFSEADVLELELQLLLDPEAGDVIPGAKGLRKLRRPVRGRGKSGGARVVYYLVTSDQKILLLYAYAKNVQGDLTPSQTKLLIQVVQKEFP